MMRRLRAWQTALACGAGLIAAYFLLPHGSTAQAFMYNAIGVLGVGAILVAIRVHRPEDRLTWVLFATGLFCSVVGDAFTSYYDASGHTAPTPSAADVIYLAAYPFLAVAVLRLGHQVVTRHRREHRTDAAIVALGALALCWYLLIGAYARQSGTGWADKATLIANPVLDVVLVFALTSALIFGGARSTAHKLVALAMTIMLIGDIGYGLLRLHGAYASGDAIDLTWLARYVLVGVAALHPSMAAQRASLAPEQFHRRGWLPTVAISAAIPPVLLLVSSLRLHQSDIWVLAVASLVLTALITLRIDWMFVRMHRQADELSSQARVLRKALAARDDLEADLRHQAFHDSLTGLANRALLGDRLEHALAAGERSGNTVGLILCDLDGFKTVNDSLGHQAGDDLLITMAGRLTAAVRAGDTVARLGGDEFAIIMDQVFEKADAITVANRIVTLLREPVRIDDQHSLVISGSVGLTLGQFGTSPEQLLSEADAAMYEAKASGKNSYTVFEPSMRSRAIERLRLTNAFEGSIDRNEFFLEFQPHFALDDGHLQGFEALVRWHHPSLGTVAPLRFIPLAEETGFIVPLGRWVLQAACAAAVEWPSTEHGPLTVSVNISARQLADPALVNDVAHVLATTGLPGHCLIIEITESMLVTDQHGTVEALNGLKEMGVRVAVDDFGTGYSSLGQLRNFPVDILKIDKSFVDQLDGGGDRNGAGLVEAIIRLARELGLATVAEGIEHQVQQEALARMGCLAGQGFLLSRPLSARLAENVARRAASGRELAYLPLPEGDLRETG